MGSPGEAPGRGGPEGDEHRVATALREALPTRRHGEMLFDMVAEILGPSARVEAASDGSARRLFRLEGTDPRWVIPWPLLSLSLRAPGHFPLEIPGLEPAPPRLPRPGKAPNLRNLGPGWVTIHDGLRYVQVGYEEDGRWCETVRGGPPDTLEGTLSVLAAGGAPTVERLADHVSGFDVARHGPGRAYLPVPRGAGAESAWRGGLQGIREALARGAAPAGAAWAASDSFARGATGWGPSKDEALFAWNAEVVRLRPGPPPPQGPIEIGPMEGGEGPEAGEPGVFRLGIHLRGTGPTGPAPPPPPPDRVSGALVRLGDLPAAPPAIGEWRRFLGNCGDTVPVAVRPDPHGWTAAGDRLLAALAAPDLEAALDEADRVHDRVIREHPMPRPEGFPEPPWGLRQYRLVSEHSGTPVEPLVEKSMGLREGSVPTIEGDGLRTRALRMRPTKAL